MIPVSQRSQKNNKQVNRAIRSKSDYLIKASNPLNRRWCTLLTSTPFSRMPKLSRAIAHPWQPAITPVSWRSLALYKTGRLDGLDAVEFSSHLELKIQENKLTQLGARLNLVRDHLFHNEIIAQGRFFCNLFQCDTYSLLNASSTFVNNLRAS